MPGVVELAVLGLVFVGVVLGVLAAARRGEAYLRVHRRLHASGEAVGPTFEASNIIKPQAVKNPVLAWVQSATSLKDAADRDRISKLLFQAGFEHPAAAIWFVIARFGAAIGLPMVFLFTQTSSDKPLNSTALAAFALAACAAGFILPRAVVDRLAENRRKQLEREFPDALDLMVVCVEAGLGLEAAFVRVSEEVRESHPRIAHEFALLSQEMRAGRTRAEALRGFASRTDVPAVRSFAALLIQTDKLGTSIGQTLRTYSQEMREDRFMKAEEKAMRIPVLMTVPLVACILPVIVTALLLPGIIDMIRHGLPALRGTGG